MGKQTGPGKSWRKGLSLLQVAEMFPTDEAAEAWYAGIRWPDGPRCPDCGTDNVQHPTKHPTMSHRCRPCRRYFSVKTGTVMQRSNLGYRAWAIAIYLFNTNLKGVSSMKLHRDLGISQSSAWHLAHRIRESWDNASGPFAGPVEADESYIGGKAKNMHARVRRERITGRGALDKVPVAAVKDRATGTVAARVVPQVDGPTLRGFVASHTAPSAEVYTDEASAYAGLPRHTTVRHSAGEYVNEMAHINGVESFWAGLKRGYHGTHHHMSAKHLARYVAEFAGRHNARPLDTIEMMRRTAA